MSLSCGIVGLPNVGKSTLFNALVAKGQAQTGKHPFTTIEKNVGVVPVRDQTLQALAKMAGITNTVSVTMTFIDIAGLVKGANRGEGLGNQFLAHIREVDLLLHVVRFFSDPTISHVHEAIDPENDAAIVETELLLSDIESLKKQLEKLETEALLLGQKILSHLDAGQPVRAISLSEEEKKLGRRLSLITSKPLIYIANIDERELATPSKKVGIHESITLCAKFEEELSKLPWVEQRQFLKIYGLTVDALEMVVKRSFHALDLLTFYTIVGGKEARAWALENGSTYLEAAAKVHSDFAEKFIRAEAVEAETLLGEGSWQVCREKGLVHTRGKADRVRPGEVLLFHHS